MCERLDEEHVRPAELPRLRAIRAQHTPGTVATLHDDADAADDRVLLEMRRCAESDFGAKICDHERAGGVEGVPGKRSGLCRHQRLADTALLPSFARTHQEATVLRLQLEDLAELDVQASGNELGGGVEQVGPPHSR